MSAMLMCNSLGQQLHDDTQPADAAHKATLVWQIFVIKTIHEYLPPAL